MRQCAQRAAHHAATIENQAHIRRQAEFDKGRRGDDRAARRSEAFLDPARAFPCNTPIDYAAERAECEASAAAPTGQMDARRARAERAVSSERAQDSEALRKSLALHQRDRAARHELHAAQQRDLARDWQRQMDCRVVS